MSIHKATAIILKRNDFRNTSLLVSVITPQYGRFKGIVKGVKASYTKFATSFEPLSLNEIIFYAKPKSDLFLISQGEVLALPKICSPYITACGAYCAEIIERLIAPLDPHKALFDLLQTTVHLLQHTEHPEVVLRYFEVQVLKALGCMPQADTCGRCGVELDHMAYFSYENYLCSLCCHEDDEVIRLSEQTRTMMRFLYEATWDELTGAALVLDDDEALSGILQGAIEGHLSWPLRTAPIRRQLQPKKIHECTNTYSIA